MKAKVNEELCVGCELCVNTCPEVFEMQDGKAIVKADPVPQEAEENCKKSKEDCPVEAIELE
ncbi:MAG: ferredoxin [Candidatus Omnitrophica bacterium]|nr:ferredoxin [Candidatus Omnitrophota bacterium]